MANQVIYFNKLLDNWLIIMIDKMLVVAKVLATFK